MSLGQKLLELRKLKGLSQEEVAEKLECTRQTVSKWETDVSTPDFDKIGPLCDLYEISADKLLRGLEEKEEAKSIEVSKDEIKIKRAKGIGTSILVYFISVAWIMVAIPVMELNPIVASAIFLVICGIATYIIVYTSICYRQEKTKKEIEENKTIKTIDNILSLITLIIYLIISFTTFAWHITWIIWIIYALIIEVVKLLFMLKGDQDEK